MPLHVRPGHVTNNVEIAGLAAPRPLLVVSCGADWTRHVPDLELPFLRHVYRLHGVEERVANAHFPDEEHDYGASKRQAAYGFLIRHLGLNPGRWQGPHSDHVDEGTIVIESHKVLEVFGGRNPLPTQVKASGSIFALPEPMA